MSKQQKIVMIPVDKIRVINPRSRNKVKFQKNRGQHSETRVETTYQSQPAQ